jgi:hypothetical protein
MQVTQCLAQPRTTAAWDSSARANPTRGRQNSFAFLFHVGELFEIFSNWATPLNPKAHCFVAAPESHHARANLVVLGAATYDGANFHTKLEQWLTQNPSVVQSDGAHLDSCTGGGSVSSHHPNFHALHYPASSSSSVRQGQEA